MTINYGDTFRCLDCGRTFGATRACVIGDKVACAGCESTNTFRTVERPGGSVLIEGSTGPAVERMDSPGGPWACSDCGRERTQRERYIRADGNKTDFLCALCAFTTKGQTP